MLPTLTSNDPKPPALMFTPEMSLSIGRRTMCIMSEGSTASRS